MTGDDDGWAGRAENALSEAGYRRGYRRGRARRAMLDLLDGQPCAVSAVEIEDRLRSDVRSVSRASVSRILEVVLHGACADCES